MPPANPAASPAGGLLGRVEQAAWRVPLPTRRLYLALAVVAAAALAASGLIAGWVANRNADTIADAREEGLELATAVTEYRTNLASADATAAATLLAAGLESTESRAQYDQDLLAASAALTRAGLVARDDDRDNIQAMSDGLVRYAGLVETSRANSRLGHPVGSAYLNQARQLVNDDLVPTADQLRREGERRMAQAANSVGGPLSALAVVLLLGGVVVLAGCAALVAGRTRRVVAHPVLLVSLVAIVAALAVVFNGILSQGRELRQAASGDIEAYVDANEAASELANLRVTELSAVAARGSGAALYDEFDLEAEPDPETGELPQAQVLLAELDEGADDPGVATLRDAVAGYVAQVHEVRDVDVGGDNPAAARRALDPDGSAGAYDRAAGMSGASADPAVPEAGDADPTAPEGDAVAQPGTAAGNVALATADLEGSFDDAADADIHPAVPIVLAGLAAVLAAGGILARGRRYR